jgi:pyruvate dehydrogenase E2 component (dihydrolipoamide acetyltransferase)
MADVEAAKAGGGAKIIPMPGAAAPAPVAAPAPAALASGPSADSVKKLFAEGSY